jgi:hypothetical protein
MQTLSDPVKRQTYDDWAKQVKYRYIPGVTQKAEGGEDILLDEFDRIGLNCDATSQLVVLCEVTPAASVPLKSVVLTPTPPQPLDQVVPSTVHARQYSSCLRVMTRPPVGAGVWPPVHQDVLHLRVLLLRLLHAQAALEGQVWPALAHGEQAHHEDRAGQEGAREEAHRGREAAAARGPQLPRGGRAQRNPRLQTRGAGEDYDERAGMRLGCASIREAVVSSLAG